MRVDALTNYISGYGIKNGKIIRLTRIYDRQRLFLVFMRHWPGMLISCKLPLPKIIFIHGFITANGEKMSKSMGNNDLIRMNWLKNIVRQAHYREWPNRHPVEYYLLREIPSSRRRRFSYKVKKDIMAIWLMDWVISFARVSTFWLQKPSNLRKNNKNLKKKINEVEKIVGKQERLNLMRL